MVWSRRLAPRVCFVFLLAVASLRAGDLGEEEVRVHLETLNDPLCSIHERLVAASRLDRAGEDFPIDFLLHVVPDGRCVLNDRLEAAYLLIRKGYWQDVYPFAQAVAHERLPLSEQLSYEGEDAASLDGYGLLCDISEHHPPVLEVLLDGFRVRDDVFLDRMILQLISEDCERFAAYRYAISSATVAHLERVLNEGGNLDWHNLVVAMQVLERAGVLPESEMSRWRERVTPLVVRHGIERDAYPSSSDPHERVVEGDSSPAVTGRAEAVRHFDSPAGSVEASFPMSVGERGSLVGTPPLTDPNGKRFVVVVVLAISLAVSVVLFARARRNVVRNPW